MTWQSIIDGIKKYGFAHWTYILTYFLGMATIPLLKHLL